MAYLHPDELLTENETQLSNCIQELWTLSKHSSFGRNEFYQKFKMLVLH